MASANELSEKTLDTARFAEGAKRDFLLVQRSVFENNEKPHTPAEGVGQEPTGIKVLT